MENVCITPTTQKFSNQPVAASAAKLSFATSRYPQLLKSGATYVIDALGEGLKQNFLGADIDMEFFALTVRSFTKTSVRTVKKLINKYGAQGNQPNPKRYRSNQHTLLQS